MDRVTKSLNVALRSHEFPWQRKLLLVLFYPLLWLATWSTFQTEDKMQKE